MEKPKLVGHLKEIHNRQVSQQGYEQITLVIHSVYENGTYKRDLTTPVQVSGKLPAGLEKFDKLNIGIGAKIEIPYLTTGYQSRDKQYWNAKVEGDLFGLKVLEPTATADIPFGEEAVPEFLK